MTASRVAVLGCGYVGSALVRRLAHAGHDCVATTTTPERVDAIRRLGAKPTVIRLAETRRLHALLCDREVVVLTAGAGGAKRSYREVYLDGARSVLRASAETPVGRIVYTSSTGVYGQNDGGWVDETSTTEPSSERGRILVAAERCLLQGAPAMGMTAAVLRLSGIYGPGRDPAERARAQAGRDRSDGDVYVNLIHLDDVVAAIATLVNASFHGVLNLTDDRPATRRERCDPLIAAAGLAPIRWTSESPPTARGKRVRNDLIKRALGLRLIHPHYE